ncbi:TRNA-intron lyase [Aphelenchoides besseyi]|nr:TRNA-intron lyase [Aphelenchoides besseyi]
METQSTSTDENTEIFIDIVGTDEFFVFDSNSVNLLWDRYRIVGDSIESTANDYGAKQLPVGLMPEQVQVLLECGFVNVRKVVNFEGSVFPSNIGSDIDTEELRKFARMAVKGRLMKDRKRKAAGDGASSKKLKIRRTEIEAEEEVLDESEVDRTFEELLTKKTNKLKEEYLQLNYESPADCYKILDESEVVFPSANDYRIRLVVFRDLWRKGFFLTSGRNFGCHFLAYEGNPGEVHAKYMIYCQHSTQSMSPFDLMSLSRVANQVRKEILLAVVSDDILNPYYMRMSCFSSPSSNRFITGTLHSVDQYLNVKLVDISVQDTDRHPHMLSVKNCFIRGSVVRYIQLPTEGVDTQLLQEATRKEILQSRQQQTKQQAA